MSFQEFADWFEGQLTADLYMLPLDEPCTCKYRRKLTTHLPDCAQQLAASIRAMRQVLRDARREPPDYSMRVAAMVLGTAYEDRDGYEDGWQICPVLPLHIQEIVNQYPKGYAKRERPVRNHETVGGD